MTARTSRSTGAVVGGAVCLAIVIGMIVVHAWPLWTGRPALLAVEPVDPRSLFRGEYVSLFTPASRLITGPPPASSDTPPSADARPRPIAVTPVGAGWAGLPADPGLRDRDLSGAAVYVQFEPRGDAEHAPVTVSLEPVEGALNLRGRVQYASGAALSVDYGLDAYYMQEGTARPVEDAIRDGRRVQMEIAIADSGRARIRRLLIDGAAVGR